MRRTMMAGLALALVLPLAGQAQQRGERSGMRRPGAEGQMPRGGPGGGVAFMLEKAEELKLTTDQQTRLRALQAGLDEKVTPLRAQLDSLRPADGAGNLTREQLQQRRKAAGEIMTVMREHHQGARTEALALLSDEQRNRFEKMETERRREMQSQRRGDRGEMGGRGGRRGGGGGRRGGGGSPPAGA